MGDNADERIDEGRVPRTELQRQEEPQREEGRLAQSAMQRDEEEREAEDDREIEV